MSGNNNDKKVEVPECSIDIGIDKEHPELVTLRFTVRMELQPAAALVNAVRGALEVIVASKDIIIPNRGN